MLKLVFNRRYSFKGADDKACEVEVLLPADKEGYLVPELRDQKEVVFGWELSKTWGHYDRETNTRFYSIKVGGSSWEEVEKQADELIDDAVEQLRKVHKKNIEELGKAPKDREEVYILDE
jgi:hypothetical protein